MERAPKVWQDLFNANRPALNKPGEPVLGAM